MDIVARLVVAVVLITSIVVLSIVLGLVWTMPDIPEVMTNEYNICLPGTDEDRALTCGRMYQQLHEYLERANQEQLKQLHAAEEKSAEEDNKDDDGTGMFSIREWRHGRDSHANGGSKRYGMKYRNGRIVVPVSGTYIIYSFVDMYQPCKDGVPTIDNIVHQARDF